MASNKVTELLQSRGDFVDQQPLVRGYISGAVGPGSSLLAAPTGFCNGTEQTLWVVAPEYSVSRPLGPCQWNQDHGATLPVQYAKCVVAFDTEGVPTVVWWEGAPSGISNDRETLAIAGAVSAEEFPGFFVEVGTGESLHLVAARYQLLGGTSVNVEVRKNKAPVAGYEALAVSKTAGSTSSSKPLANGDYINWKTSSPSGSPKGLSVTLFLK